MITVEKCLEALKQVIDPTLKQDIVTLNMVENLNVELNNIKFDVLLNSPTFKVKQQLEEDCRKVLTETFGELALIDINLKKRPNLGPFPGVKHIIAVSSGKGGVGKSTVTANLALALSKLGNKVGIMDADIYGPSMPLMFGLENARPGFTVEDGKNKFTPVEKLGLKILSIGFMVGAPQAVVWRGPMASSAIRQFVVDCSWGELDFLLIDLPPGTGDIHLSIVAEAKPNGAVVVTTPQEVALADARKGIDMFKNPSFNIPVLGVVENMSYFTPAELPDNKYYIFGKDGGKRIAEEFNVPFLGEVPLEMTIREAADDGAPITIQGDFAEASPYFDIARNVMAQVAEKA